MKRLHENEVTYEKRVFETSFCDWSAKLEPSWNSLDRYVQGETRLLHCTTTNLQPWFSRDNPLAPIWVTELMRDLEEGFLSLGDLARAVAAKAIRPSLLLLVLRSDVEMRADVWFFRILNRLFVPPHKQTRPAKSRILKRVHAFLFRAWLGANVSIRRPRTRGWR